MDKTQCPRMPPLQEGVLIARQGMPAQECAETPRTGGDSRRMEPVPEEHPGVRAQRDAMDRVSVAADWTRVSSGRSESMVRLPASPGLGDWAGAGGGRAVS